MISISQLFELTTRTKNTLKTSGKLIGSGVALGLTGVGKVADHAGQSLYKSINKKDSPLSTKEDLLVSKEDNKDLEGSKK